MKKVLFCLIKRALLSACTDAQQGKIFALGDCAKVEGLSGGTMMYSGSSTGKISSERNR